MTGMLTGRDGLIWGGVANLRAFGYPHVTPQNILTDQVYKRFFISMLKDNLPCPIKSMENDIKKLLEELDRPSPSTREERE